MKMVEAMSVSPSDPRSGNASLPLSKLRGVPFAVRAAPKARRINSCAQLLAAASSGDKRSQLASQARIDEGLLLTVVRRADMARINGIGAVFGMMLEDLGILEVPDLASQDAQELHGRLRQYNQEERIARRSPTPEEVIDWITQARGLPPLVTS